MANPAGMANLDANCAILSRRLRVRSVVAFRDKAPRVDEARDVDEELGSVHQ